MDSLFDILLGKSLSGGGGGGGGGTSNYNALENKPQINGTTLTGNKSLSDLGIAAASDIPTVNNGTLTIQKNGTKIDEFKANQSANTTINITVPTTASDVSALPDTTKYAASSTAGGSATSAVKLDNAADAGATNKPVYFNNGKPTAIAYEVNKAVPADAVFTDTTYESRAAASGGTAVSLVTTGEKYTWNNKSDLELGNTATTAAAGNHTHTLNIATDAGTSQISLAPNTKYKLTGGGETYVFTTPADTTYTFDGTYSASTNKAATVSTVTNAINALDVTGASGISAAKTISAWSETDGKVSVSTQDIAITGTQAVLTGYQKSTTAGQAVAATDNVNQAIGKVEKRVSDNENNILLSLDANGQKNLFKTTLTHYTHNGVVFDKVNDYTIKLTTASATTAQASCIINDVAFPQNKYAIKVVADDITLANDNVFVNVVYDVVGGVSNQNVNVIDDYVFRNNTIIIKQVLIYVRSGKQPNGTIQVMVCPTALYDISDKIQAYALPNTTLTSGLNSYIENGVRNFAKYNHNMPSWSGVTINVSDDAISVSGTSSSAYTGFICTALKLLAKEPFVIKIIGTYSGFSVITQIKDTSGTRLYWDLLLDRIIPTGYTIEGVYLQRQSATSSTVSGNFNVLITPKAIYDLGVKDYEPYALSNAELTAKEQTNENNILSTAVYGTCDTAGATAAKIVDVPSGFVLRAGCVIGVRFTNSNSASNVTLNVGGTGDKSIRLGTSVYAGSRTNITGNANYTIYYMYDGEYWGWISNGMLQPAMTAAEASAGTSTADRFISAKVLSDAIDERIQPILAALQANNNRAISYLKSAADTRLAAKGIVEEEAESIKR